MADIHTHQFENGLVLVAEPVAGVRSLALSLLTPAGVTQEPADRNGVAPLLSEMICRGAGELDARAHCDALDTLGVSRGTNADSRHLRVSATMLADKLPDALPLLTDMVRQPMLDADALPPSRDLALQSLDALEDEPQSKVFVALRARHYPAPLDRSPYGTRADLEAMTLDDLRAFWQRACVPGGAVMGVAGHFDWNDLRDRVGQTLGQWSGSIESAAPAPDATGPRGYYNESAESAQVHIGVAYDAPPEPDETSILQRAATAVLAGGMSGRLFTEVREKRGLCYSVFATYSGQKDRGVMLAYAGTTVPRAQETLDVMTAELRRVHDGVEADEFNRAIVGMKSRLVMQGESTGARAGAIAMDQYLLGRPRTLDELAARVDSVTLDRLNDYLAANRPGPMTVVTVGPEALTPPQ